MSRKLDARAPVVFLDFDGVLHPDLVYRVRGRISMRVEGVALFEWAPVLEEQLARHVAVQIVLSSSWVRVLGFSRAVRWLPPVLRSRVVGATWHSAMEQNEWNRLTRYLEIVTYVHRHGVTRWIAIDNDAIGWPDVAYDRLVRTDNMRGLGDERAQKELAEKLLCLTIL